MALLHPTKQKIRATVGLLAGLGLLAGMTVYLGSAPSPNIARVAGESQRAAAVATYTSSGNWTAPGGVTSVTVTIVGGGGGGSSGAWSEGGCNGDAGLGGAGGAGGYISNQVVSVTPGQAYSVVVGSGGAGGPRTCGYAQNNAYPGGSSSFGSVTATGGGAGVWYAGGAGGTPQVSACTSKGFGRWSITVCPYNGTAGNWYCSYGTTAGINSSGYGSGGRSYCAGWGQAGQAGYVSISYVDNPPPPVPSLSLTPAASTIAYNGAQTLSYSATGGGGYDACYLAGGQWGSSPGTAVGTSGSATTNPLTSNTTYSYTCHDTYYDWQGPVTATVAVGAQAPTVALLPSSQTILSGQNAGFTYTLGGGAPTSVTYRVNGGTAVPASGGSFSVGGLGVGSHTIVMTVANAGGSNTSNTASVAVNAPCPANCPGPGAPNCIADSGYTYNPGNNTCTFNDICTDIPGSQASVSAGCVMPNPNPGACIPGGYFYDPSLNQCVTPGLSLTAAPARVQKGNSTTLAWSAQNITAGSCTLKNSSGATLSSAPGGSMQVVVTGQTIYTLSCGSPVGVKTKSVTVSLIPSFKEI